MLAMQPAQLLPLLRFIEQYKAAHPSASKEDIKAAINAEFHLTKRRSVYPLLDGAIRISEANTGSFSNTVLGLATLKTYDDKPFVVVVVRPERIDFLLANSTFLKKISHTSHQLRVDNIKGSFLGHDIMRELDGQENNLANIDSLFVLHRDIGWEDNLIRLVEATSAIVATGRRFDLNDAGRQNIFSAPRLASIVAGTPEYREIGQSLSDLVRSRADEVLAAATIDNVNTRGNTIEQIITRASNLHGLSDLFYSLPEGIRLAVDVKTKLLNRASNPKLYNIDKTLQLLSTGTNAFSLLLVGIDPTTRSVVPRFVSVFDRVIVDCTRVQFHWAGRSSRGVTQLTGDIARCFAEGYVSTIDVERAQAMLTGFLDR
jgi:hypothetical protein